MKVTVVGAGYVGMSNAAALAAVAGHEVTVLEVDEHRANQINARQSTVADPELQQALQTPGLPLTATLNAEAAYRDAEAVLIATPTDYDPATNYFDTSSVEQVLTDAAASAPGALIIIKSTVPVGFTESMRQAHPHSAIVFSPEFLREGTGYHDATQPSRIVIGETGDAGELLDQISATALPNTVIVEITATDPSPARAQQLSQTTAEVFSGFVPEWEGATPEGQAPIQATIVDRAPLPVAPVAPKPTLNIALGALLGLFVGLGLAVLRETLDNTVKGGADLEALTESATLGTILADNDAPKSPLITQIAATSGRAESFRVLRTNLQFVDADKPSRIFTITSAVPSEGKSTTSVNLAISLAQSGQKVVLLETDLRRPKIAQYLRMEKSVGLTTVLIGRAGLDDVIQPWGSDGLDVITSGAVPPNPAELLQSASFGAVLAELRARYQIVVIDAPPLLPVTDAALVAEQTDGAILIVRFGKTTREQVLGAAKRLEAVGASLLGNVLNFVPSRGSRAYGYGYGEYGYGYGYAPDAPDDTPRTRREHRAAEKAEKAAARQDKAAGRGADREARTAARGGRRSTPRVTGPTATIMNTTGADTGRVAPAPTPRVSAPAGPTRIPPTGSTFAAGGVAQRVAAAIQAEEQRAMREYQVDPYAEPDFDPADTAPPYAPKRD